MAAAVARLADLPAADDGFLGDSPVRSAVGAGGCGRPTSGRCARSGCGTASTRRWRGRWPRAASPPTAAKTISAPTLKALFPDPSSFTGMDEAARVLIDAMESGRPTVVFADYDVDGASSAALLVRWWRAMGRELPIYVPDRLLEGYGPSPAAFRRLREAGYELAVTVDCGAAAYDALNAAGEIGLEVAVIDHHLMREEPPLARALVNPNQPGCEFGQGVLAAAGVTFGTVGRADPRGAPPRLVRDPARARPAPMARPRGAGRHL